MSTLYVQTAFQIDSDGSVKSGHQGASTSNPQDALGVTVTGTVLSGSGRLLTDTVRDLYEAALDFPATFDYLWFKADQPVYLQLVAGANSVTVKLAANQPFVLPGFGSLVLADSTDLDPLVEPTPVAIDSVLVGNYSGSTANYSFSVID